MTKLKALLVTMLAVLVAVPAFAETQNVKVSGSLDAYAFYRNNFDLTKGNDSGAVPVAVGTTVPGTVHSGAQLPTNQSSSDTFYTSITQVQVAANLTDNVSTVIDLINQRDWNADQFGTNTSNATNEFDVLVDLAYVQMKEIFYSPLTLTVGRQNLVFGRGFIVGWNPQNPNNTFQATEFTQIQSFDAVRATFDFNPWTIDLVDSKVREGSTNAEDDHDLYIAYLTYKFSEYNAVAEAYYTGDFDRNSVSGAAGSKGNSTDTVGGRVQFDPITQITLGGEVAYQFGDYYASVTAPSQTRDAWAVDVFGEYHWDNTWKPVAGLEYVYLSGESDLSSGNSSYGSWNGAFRLPVYGWIHDYLEVYYATGSPSDQAAGQNQQDICLYGSIKPMTDLQLSAQFYHFWTTATAHSTITNPNSSSLSSDIGNEIDTLLTYNYTADVTFNTYANWFIPGKMFSSPNNATATEVIQEVKVTF